jgi:hypothetical protein
VNEEIGPFRAAAAQAEVLLTGAQQMQVPQRMWREAMRTMFGELLMISTLKELQEGWDAKAQEAARKVLVAMHEQIALSFYGHDRTRFMQAVGSL